MKYLLRGTLLFFPNKEVGVDAMIKGKYLFFMFISCLCFVLSVPYAYFGWDFLLIHLATFLSSMGVTVLMVVLRAIWKPKSMFRLGRE